MTPFLQRVANTLLDSSPKDLEKTILLFPNRRPAGFFKLHIKKNNISGAMILPRMQGIDDFVTSVVPYAIADAVTVNASLFTIFQQLGIQKETYDLFYSWGEMLVRDFDELDKCLADPRQVFSILLNEKQIASQFAYLEEEQIKTIQRFWSTFNPQKITQEQALFLKLWKSLPEVYQQLNFELTTAGRTYLGHAYRILAENPETYLHHRLAKNSKFIIAGFNRITPAEVSLFMFLRTHFDVSFFWDVDTHYTEPTIHEAGYFYRKFSSLFPSVLPPQQNINSNGKKVTLYACSKFVVQAQQTARLIREIENKDETIAIILPDESRLPVVLAALADESGVNVTMGIQVRGSLTASFISQWIEIQRFVRKEDGCLLYHVSRLNNLINHPMLLSIQDEETQNTWKQVLEESPSNLISPNLLPKGWEPVKRILIPPADGISMLCMLKEFFHSYIQIVADNNKGANDEMQKSVKHPTIQFELTVAFYHSLVILIHSCLANNLHFNVQTASRLIMRLLRNSKAPFESNSDGRIQVMGLIESQCLDFDHVFILDFNEGSIPPGISDGSYIPLSIRRGFGLPVPDDYHRMYAYFFYRLMHQSKNMHLFYNTISDGTIGSEPSRFAAQILAECDNIEIEVRKQQASLNIHPPTSITIQKTPEIIGMLMRYTERANNTYLTPSALNQYLDCRLRFYFRYIADLQEPPEITDEIDHAVLGNLLHYAMHTIYTQAIQKKGSSEFSAKQIKQLSSYIPTAANLAFHEVLNGKKSDANFYFEGAILIARSILIKYIEAILEFDEKCAPISIIRMEEKDVVTLSLAGRNVRIGGKIDRLDISKGIVRVIDYKTGSNIGKTEFASIEELFEFNNEKRPGYIFQVMLYAYITDVLMDKDMPIQPGLLFVRDSFKENFETTISHKIGKNEFVTVNDYRVYRAKIEAGLNRLIADLFDPEVPFSQTENTETCKNCAYRLICRRDL